MKRNVEEECPSCSTIGVGGAGGAARQPEAERTLSQWPIQIKLIGTVAPFLNDADLLVAADCTAFATRGFHDGYLRGRKLLIGCPKLDNAQLYVEKFTEIFSGIPIRSVSCLRMEVPCCGGMTAVLAEAIRRSGKDLPLRETIIGVRGDLLAERDVPPR
jgi:hypothetical protein